MLNDLIADLLTRIRNSLAAKHRYVDVTLSKMNVAILEVMKKTGFIRDFIINKDLRLVRVFLKYDRNRRPLIKGIKRISTPGCRQYVKSSEIPVVNRGIGIAILSTSKGVMHGLEAKKQCAGGELLCSIW